MRWIIVVLLAVMLVTGCGGNPYLDASLKPAELQGKDKAWFEKNWGAPSGKTARFLAAKPGPTIALPAANQDYPSLTSHPISARLRSNLTKKKNSPTLVTLAVNPRAVLGTCARRIGCRSNTSAPQYLPLSPLPLEQIPCRRDLEPCDFSQEGEGPACPGL